MSDALGSTDRLLSSAQAVTDSYVYRAFGELASSTGSTTNPFRWVGELGYYYDPVGSQSDYYVRARWFKPAIARWLSMDPLGFGAGEWNLFRYVGNRVMVAVDPMGLVGPVDPWGPRSPNSGKPSTGVLQCCMALLNGASVSAMLDAGPGGEIYRDAMSFGDEWQKKKGGDWGNAARHAYWQIALTCKYGPDVATAIGDAHECGQECIDDSRADQFNNIGAQQIGRLLSQPCTKDQIREAAEKSLVAGEFITDIKHDPRLPPPPAGCKD